MTDGIRIFEIGPDGVREVGPDDGLPDEMVTELLTDMILNIARRGLVEYSVHNFGEVMQYTETYPSKQECAKDMMQRLTTFVMMYVDRILIEADSATIMDMDMDEFSKGANAAMQDYLKEIITKRLKEKCDGSDE